MNPEYPEETPIEITSGHYPNGIVREARDGCFGDWRGVNTKVARPGFRPRHSWLEVLLLSFYIAGGYLQDWPGVYVDVEA